MASNTFLVIKMFFFLFRMKAEKRKKVFTDSEIQVKKKMQFIPIIIT